MHTPSESKLRPDSPEWPRRANTLLTAIERKRRQSGAEEAPPRRLALTEHADANSVELALLVNGVHSSSSDDTLDAVGELFAPTMPVICFNYKGYNEQPYGPADTISETITTYVERLERHLDAFSNARFHLVCHSLGGLIVTKLLYDRRPDRVFRDRIASVFLLASPIKLRGGVLYTQVCALGPHNVAWKVVQDYSVVVRELPTLPQIVTIHCEDDKDLLALYDTTCLLSYDRRRLIRGDYQVGDGATHFTLPSRPETIERIRTHVSTYFRFRDLLRSEIAGRDLGFANEARWLLEKVAWQGADRLQRAETRVVDNLDAVAKLNLVRLIEEVVIAAGASRAISVDREVVELVLSTRELWPFCP
jgi:pimeloyl-ACP methyl ester carboxylesterase